MLISHYPSFFKARRNTLMANHPDAVFIFPSNDGILGNLGNALPFKLRQESNFYYLTGFEEPESFLVLAKNKMILFLRPRNPERELWDGERYGIEGALNTVGADEAYPVGEFDQKLAELLQASERIFYRVGLSEAIDRRIFAALEVHRKAGGRTGRSLCSITDPTGVVGEMRIFKSNDEMVYMRKVAQISALAHKTAMEQARPGMMEYELAALVEYIFKKNGCERPGFGTIIASGANATSLHYQVNNDILKDGELVLIDAGGEYGYYSGDISRTFPIGKTFSPTQAKVYDLVLKVQKEAIAKTKPGVKLPDIHKEICEGFIEGYLSLGLMKGNKVDIMKNNGFRRFFPHSTSHWLGIDTHDVGLYLKSGEPRPLEPGMVFTIEPGFYVQPSDKEAPEEYRNIGIRIEDDILVTQNGCEVLSEDAPKERSAIETLRARAF